MIKVREKKIASVRRYGGAAYVLDREGRIVGDGCMVIPPVFCGINRKVSKIIRKVMEST